MCSVSFSMFAAMAREGDVRLFGGSTDTTGVLEVFFNNKWGMICNGATFNTDEATVVCRQLGYDPSPSTYMSASTRYV